MAHLCGPRIPASTSSTVVRPLVPWAVGMVSPLFPVYCAQSTELCFTAPLPKNDPGIPIYDAPGTTLTAMETWHFVQAHAFAHFCYELSDARILLTHLRGKVVDLHLVGPLKFALSNAISLIRVGRYILGVGLILSPPTIHTTVAQ